MHNDDKSTLTATHWGTYRVETKNGALTAVHPFEEDPDPSPIGQGYLGVIDDPMRIKSPMVRKSWLENGPGSSPEARGTDPFVAVSWDTVEKLVADELLRVREIHGNEAIYAGSYGWASAGRFHHAQGHLKRFLNLFGGFTKSVNSYSLAAGQVILSHILGSDRYIYDANSWQSIVENTEFFVAFGGVPIKNGQIGQGGLGKHRQPGAMREAVAAGIEFVNVSPLRSDVMHDAGAEWIAPRPSTDAALLIALAHTLLVKNLHDPAFLNRHTVGFDRYKSYLLGAHDGIEKSAEWASAICDIPADTIRNLATKMAAKRTMISLSWSLTRQDHGEQPFWAGTVLAAMLGQIGLPGGGVGYGYSAVNTIGLERQNPKYQAMPQGKNSVKSFIPVARITDMLENPGTTFPYNGETHEYPDTRLIYWAGGNPFHHHQDLNRMRRAWAKPDTIIVNEWCWNPMAKHADIVLPCTTPLERRDITLSPRDPYIISMEPALPPIGDARDDYDIFRGIARHLGLEQAFSEGRNADEWQTWLYEKSRQSAALSNITLPPLDELRANGWHHIAVPETPYVMLSDFRENPTAAPLNTPSGKIEIFSDKIASFALPDCPGHPAWMEPAEWIGNNSAPHPLHLISNQPSTKLHSQLDHGPVSRAAKIADRETIMINPQDAANYAIRDGDVLRVFNDRGACLCAAVISDEIRLGVVNIATGSWFDPTDDAELCKHGNPNVLTRDKGTSSLAQGPTAHSCLVGIEHANHDTLPAVTAFQPPTIL